MEQIIEVPIATLNKLKEWYKVANESAETLRARNMIILATVHEAHAQAYWNMIQLLEVNNLKVADWLETVEAKSTLRNVLLGIFGGYEGHKKATPPFEYISEITEEKFKKIRGCGEALWKEYSTLRNM